MPADRQDARSAAPGHDAECEIDNGAVGFDGLACLCADRAKASAAQTSGDSMIDTYRYEIAVQTHRANALELELKRLRRTASVFGQRVLDGDRYGCENGPGVCLHMDAKRFLDKIKADA